MTFATLFSLNLINLSYALLPRASLFLEQGTAVLLRKAGHLRTDDRPRKGTPSTFSLAHIPFLAARRNTRG